MKKVLLIFALVLAYGITISNASVKIVKIEKSQVTVVADDDSSSINLEDDKKDKKKKAGKATVSEAAPAATGCGGCAAAAGCSKAEKKKCAEAGSESAKEKSCSAEKAEKK